MGSEANAARVHSSRADLIGLPGVSSALVDPTLLTTRYLPVAEAFAPLLGPDSAGLARGSLVSVANGRAPGHPGGQANVSLAVALIAEAMRQGSWTAVVGSPWLGLAAMRDYDVPLGQLVMIDRVAAQWGAVMAALIEGFDIVMFASRPVGGRDARRIRAHAREKEVVLVQLGDTGWPESADLALVAQASAWFGVGEGHGHLNRRLVQVEVAGRRRVGRSSSVRLWLPDIDGQVRAVTPQWAGSDIHRLVAAADDPTSDDPTSDDPTSDELMSVGTAQAGTTGTAGVSTRRVLRSV